jgi:hypothetical protein
LFLVCRFSAFGFRHGAGGAEPISCFVVGRRSAAAGPDGLVAVVPSPITLHSATISNGVFDFSFTNTPGANFTVLTTTNVSAQLSNWTALSGLMEISLGQFQFTDPQATNSPQRFYRFRAN